MLVLELSRRLDEELRQLRDTYNRLKIEYDQIKERLKFFDKVCAYVGCELLNYRGMNFKFCVHMYIQESSLDWTELEEALAAVRGGKTKALDSAPNNSSMLSM